MARLISLGRKISGDISAARADPVPSWKAVVLTYRQVIDYFIENEASAPDAVRFALYRQRNSAGWTFHFAYIDVDKAGGPVIDADASNEIFKPVHAVQASGCDEELEEMFAGTNLFVFDDEAKES